MSQGVLLRIYAPDGTLIPNREEMNALLNTQARELAALRAELGRLRGE